MYMTNKKRILSELMEGYLNINKGNEFNFLSLVSRVQELNLSIYEYDNNVDAYRRMKILCKADRIVYLFHESDVWTGIISTPYEDIISTFFNKNDYYKIKNLEDLNRIFEEKS